MRKIENQAWLTDPRLKRLFSVIEAAGGQVRLAGGAVRNALWGLPVADIDAATTLSPQKVTSAGKGAGFAVHPTGVEHGTVTIVVEGLVVEVTTLRADVETDGRRAVVSFSKDWAIDARRRDFTFNALYCDLDGRVFDETGQGLRDLEDRRVRFVGDAETRIREDYLRILRYFRFEAQYGVGVMDEQALNACVRLKSGINSLSVERIVAEMFKLLIASRVVPVVDIMVHKEILQQFLVLQQDAGLLARMVALENRLAIGADPVRRLAVVATDASHLRLSKVNHRRFKRLKEPSDVNLEQTPAQLRVRLYQLGEEAFRDKAMMAWVQEGVWEGARADDENWQSVYDFPTRWTAPVFPLTGKDLLTIGFPEGQQVGKVLVALEQAWIESDFRLGKPDLLFKAEKLKS